jgi:hypothetical protein
MLMNFKLFWDRLQNAKARVLCGGEVRGVYFYTDDLQMIGKSIVELSFASHPQIPYGAADCLDRNGFRELGRLVMQSLFGEGCPVQIGYQQRLRNKIQIWYEDESVKELVLF